MYLSVLMILCQVEKLFSLLIHRQLIRCRQTKKVMAIRNPFQVIGKIAVRNPLFIAPGTAGRIKHSAQLRYVS